ncbi:Crp/Fnr family transcriptional regulator [Chryseobacterium sp. A301]
MNPLLAQFKKFGSFSPEVESEFNSRVKRFDKKKGDFFLKEGQISSSIFVLEKGLIRAYFRNGDKEFNTWFALENELVGSVFPSYLDRPSYEYIQFMEDSVLFSITVEHLNYFYQSYPELNLIGRKIAEQLCGILEERIIELHTQDANQRYKMLLQKSPEILQRISLGHIASYLSITQETLSRIRSQF